MEHVLELFIFDSLTAFRTTPRVFNQKHHFTQTANGPFFMLAKTVLVQAVLHILEAKKDSRERG